MSAQAPLKERIEDESDKGSGNQEGNKDDESGKGAANDEGAKGAGNEESAKGATNNESDKGSGNNDIAHDSAPAKEEPITNEGVEDLSQERSSISTADKNAKAMTDLMWQEHPSMPAQKSAKTVFFEENNKGSSPKWGDQEDEDIQTAPLWNYNATNGRERFFLPRHVCRKEQQWLALSKG
jgi:hypothetical protein